jgi:hypothetical protein
MTDDERSKLNYTHEKISMAMDELILAEGDLRARVACAHRYLLRCSFVEGLEDGFARVRESLKSVRQGDYSKVAHQELLNVADAIKGMYAKVAANPR